MSGNVYFIEFEICVGRIDQGQEVLKTLKGKTGSSFTITDSIMHDIDSDEERTKSMHVSADNSEFV